MRTLLPLISRFPRPDFESGYQYPEYSYAVPNERLWDVLDVSMFLLLLGITTWAVYRRRTRGPVLWSSIVSVLYFGVLRGGCVCSIGAIQNVALAFVDNSYSLPLAVFLLFFIPLVFALLFGRVFCAGACPFGALQDLVNVRNFRINKAVAGALGVIPWIYLAFALLYALTRTRFLICQFDPFIGIFRLGGDVGVISFGVILLVMSIFTGRPFCRFICPYGALLSLFSSVQVFRFGITPKACINCELCHNSCPVDAIDAPYANQVQERSRTGVRRVLLYFLIIPVLMAAGGLLMRQAAPQLARGHREVHLYEQVMYAEQHPDAEMLPEVEAFYSQGRTLEDLIHSVEQVQAAFLLYATLAGLMIGLVIGVKLVRLSLKRGRKQYEINHARCVACGKCFSYCPQNLK